MNKWPSVILYVSRRYYVSVSVMVYLKLMKKRTKKFVLTAAGSVLVCALIVGAAEFYLWQARARENAEIQVVAKIVIDFGKKFQNVPLLAEREIAAKAVEENYAGLVDSELLEKWKLAPTSAPGRVVSSPWPDRIEISSIKKGEGDEYKVVGEVIEKTSSQEAGVAASNLRRTIRLNVEKIDGRWLITKVY